MLLAQVCQLLFYAGLFLSFAGEWLFTNVVKIESGMRLVQWMRENQMTCFGMIFLLNMMASTFMNTGAFEVYYDNELVHSKLATGQLPDLNVLVRQLVSQ